MLNILGEKIKKQEKSFYENGRLIKKSGKRLNCHIHRRKRYFQRNN